MLPGTCKVAVDAGQGRWRVISDDLQWKSISWTKRGYETAALEAIHQGWLYHCDASPHKCPFNLEELRGRFAVEAT